MSESGFASLGPSLLARKGGAKPAMRPQVAPLVPDHSVVPEDQLEDLGWNDMGDTEPQTGADIVPINADVTADDFTGGPGPIVRRQQRRLEERVLADAAMTGPDDCEPEFDEDAEVGLDDVLTHADDVAEPDPENKDDDERYSAGHSPLAPAPRAATMALPRLARVPTAQANRRAAFTLRLDADRHLKLRLAATMRGISAQVLVTEALDRLLAEYDDLNVIANHLKRH